MSSSSEETCQSHVWFDAGKREVFKTSQLDNFVCENESAVGDELNALNHPNVAVYLRTEFQKFPFESFRPTSEIDGLHCDRPVTVWRLIEGVLFSDFIGDEEISDKIVCNCVAQVVFTLLELQSKTGFVHGDLHTSNVLISKTKLKKIDYKCKDFDISFELMGYVAQIFDFGQSILWNRANHITVPLYTLKDGVVNLWNDEFFDFRVFFDSVQHDLFNSRKGEFVSDFSRLFQNLLTHFEHVEGKVIPDEEDNVYASIDKMIDEFNDASSVKSELILNGDGVFTDLLISLVDLPLNFSAQAPKNLFSPKGTFSKFLQAWCIIEKYFTLEQSSFVFKQAVNFSKCAESESVSDAERQFSDLIHSLLKLGGQSMIAISTQETSILYHSMSLVGQQLGNLIGKGLQKYYTKIRDSNNETTNMLKSFGYDTNNRTLAKIIINWYTKL